MKKVLKILGIVLLVVVAIIAVLLVYLAKRPAVPNDYTSKVKTGGDIEAKYLAMGPYEVSYLEQSALQDFKKYEIYYPTEITKGIDKYPVVIFSNGTGVKASKYTSVLKHLSSWGFIVMATEEEYAWNGFSSEMCLRFLMILDETESVEGWETNPFYGHVDFDRIGVSGHSQGGVGVINAATDNKHGNMIKTIFAASPTNMQLAKDLQWDYDPSLISVPTLLVSSTGDSDENLVVSGAGLKQIYDSIPDSIPKIMARRIDAEHGDMLSFADGYMTAWFMWQLQDDAEAAKAFIGNNAELLHNEIYQDQRSNIK